MVCTAISTSECGGILHCCFPAHVCVVVVPKRTTFVYGEKHLMHMRHIIILLYNLIYGMIYHNKDNNTSKKVLVHW